MILVGFAGTLIGLLVGVRSVVFALIPTMIGAIVAAGPTALIGDGDSVGVIAIKMQFGYLGGAAFRLSLDRGTRSNRDRNRSPVPTAHVR